MKLDTEKITLMLEDRGVSISGLLESAGVSRTAYYNIARSESLLPKSLKKIAATLDVPPQALLEDWDDSVWQKQKLIASMLKDCPELDHSTAWHTLRYLEMSPEKRLERSLESGKASAAFRD